MPTYSYQCQDCGHEYDAFQSMKDDPDTVCPKCGGRVERLIGAGAGIVFKGSGFYVTDYRKTSSSTSAPKTAEKSGGESKPAGSSDSSGGSSASSSQTGSTGSGSSGSGT